mgnify:CR=1 FL=1
MPFLSRAQRERQAPPGQNEVEALYLKALEIQGFKSFPDKTVLTFGSDITAIVGPNGSGKSNISDAIRWVMGEQNSRQLRGAKMEDVIFGGTEKRSQMGFAQVTLVIDNTEHIFPGRTRRRWPSLAATTAAGSRNITSTASPCVSRMSTSCLWTPAWQGGLLHHRTGQDRRDPVRQKR